MLLTDEVTTDATVFFTTTGSVAATATPASTATGGSYFKFLKVLNSIN